MVTSFRPFCDLAYIKIKNSKYWAKMMQYEGEQSQKQSIPALKPRPLTAANWQRHLRDLLAPPLWCRRNLRRDAGLYVPFPASPRVQTPQSFGQESQSGAPSAHSFSVSQSASPLCHFTSRVCLWGLCWSDVMHQHPFSLFFYFYSGPLWLQNVDFYFEGLVPSCCTSLWFYSQTSS